ncbi:2-dehydropantoate 2-reductase N-terminal domain-containing protein [Stigmatella sp. ncwal1]|uniref:2-dehydropantoate 2-reductase N-terminal domain-containing protein n=1 Tax=Stigmatella ashevillensis TaxID=2995309 RepID=A0ABT5D1J7_9BACT|nr:2-dehydropantoate 2-reductase N-terminal domain-containing protein [Stigmatella ashevillena]MDC0707535.1 2-dehydropantoate 2-reductase N-terminal domain-containing protein [Stigmatella ashevillena]
MKNAATSRVLIVGAGSVGLIVGYHLSLAKADVTFLVRPGRVERLSRPQTLYCYDDNSLKHYEGYSVISDHADIAEGRFDYILITLDGASLQNEDGVALTKAIGKAVEGTETKVIQGSMFVDSRRWFQSVSGLRDDQFTTGYFSFLSYPPSAVTLPLHGPTDPELLAKADQAYYDNQAAMMLDDSGPAVAEGFAELYNASGVSKVAIVPAAGIAILANAIFAMFAGCDLLGWPKFSDIDPTDETWRLAIAAMKEIQTLSMHGEAGRQAAEATTEASVLEENVAMEKQMLPLDLQEFNRFHHGGKVNKQDRALLTASLAAGRAEGKEMPALTELLRHYSSEIP